jgi:hypothetical protein
MLLSVLGWVPVVVVAVLGILFALVLLADSRRGRREQAALDALPEWAGSLGLSYSESAPPEDVVEAFLAFDPTRNDRHFENDGFSGMMAGTVLDIPILAFVYWFHLDGQLGRHFVSRVGLSEAPCPTVVARSPIWTPEEIGMPLVSMISDADFSNAVSVFSRDADFARTLYAPVVRKFVRANMGKPKDPSHQPFCFVVAGDAVYVQGSPPESREQLLQQTVMPVAFMHLVTLELQRKR